MLGNKNRASSVLAVILALAGPGCAPPDGDIAVLVAASLRDAFVEMERSFEASAPNTDVVLAGGSSSLLAAQLLEGAPGEVFATADRTQMERYLSSGGAPEVRPVVFATDRMVVVTPAANPGGVHSWTDLTRADVDVVLAAPQVPAGAYAQRFFRSHSILADVLANVVSYGPDVRDVLGKIRAGEADAGVVYAASVTPQMAGDVKVIDLPREPATIARYYIVPLSSSDGARAFVDFVLGHEGRAILAARGLHLP